MLIEYEPIVEHHELQKFFQDSATRGKSLALQKATAVESNLLISDIVRYTEDIWNMVQSYIDQNFHHGAQTLLAVPSSSNWQRRRASTTRRNQTTPAVVDRPEIRHSLRSRTLAPRPVSQRAPSGDLTSPAVSTTLSRSLSTPDIENVRRTNLGGSLGSVLKEHEPKQSCQDWSMSGTAVEPPSYPVLPSPTLYGPGPGLLDECLDFFSIPMDVSPCKMCEKDPSMCFFHIPTLDTPASFDMLNGAEALS
jgi:hypothetical protein